MSLTQHPLRCTGGGVRDVVCGPVQHGIANRGRADVRTLGPRRVPSAYLQGQGRAGGFQKRRSMTIVGYHDTGGVWKVCTLYTLEI